MSKVGDPSANRKDGGWLAALKRSVAKGEAAPSVEQPSAGEAHWRAMLDSALDGVVVGDRDGRIVEFNRAAERMFGLARRQVVGRDICETLIAPQVRAEYRRKFAGTFGEKGSVTTTGIRSDGAGFPVEVAWARPEGARDGLLVAHFRDTTERQHTQDLIRLQDELTKTIATRASDALFFLDSEGRITFVNPAGEQALGWAAAELIGAKLGELLDGAGAAPSGPAVMRRKDGERIEVVCSSSPVVRDGAVAGGVTSIRNMTGERLSERKLLELSQRLEVHLDNSPLAVVEFAPDGTILLWSVAAERLFGWTAAEIASRNLSEFPWLIEHGAAKQSERRPAARSRTKDGRILDLEWHQSECRNPGGRLVSTLWRGLDVTARNRAEQAVRENEERFRAVLEQAPSGITNLDETGRFLSVNDKYCRIVGYSREELLGRTFQDITHPGDVALDEQNLQALLEGSIPGYSREKRYIRKDGATVWVNITVARVCDSAGKFQSLLAIVDDISGRKKAEERLQQSHDRYRFLADAMPQMVFTATPDGQADYHNRSWLAYTGRTFNAMLGRGWAAAVHPEDADLCLSGWESALAAGKPYETETRLRRADGEYRWHLIRATPMRDAGGSILQWVGAAIDIEDRKRAAAELERKVLEQTAEAREQAQRAEQASLAKSEFLAMMSHEIRTPMNVIVGLADLIEERALPDNQREYVCRLRRASATLLTVINDILDLAAVESRRLSLQKIPFEPGAVVQSVVSIMEIRARARGLSLMCDMASSLPPRLTGDPDRLHQVLLNLVGNAVKFTEQGSVRLLVTGMVDNGLAMLTFSVADTGIGIPTDKQALIFEPFTQADSSITRQYGGTGLGLTISRQLVDLMEGRMWLESEPGRGSTFSFSVTFPVLEPKIPAARVEASAPAPGSSERRTPAPEQAESRREILLVDDSPDNVFLIQEFLKDSPYTVDVAENGMDALTKVQTRHYDVVLMDVQMPVIDGHTATRVIRAWEVENHTPPVPILALTAHALLGEVEKSMQVGCNAHLSKPIQRQALLAALAQYTGRSSIERVTVTPPVGFEDLSRDYLTRRKEGMTLLRGMLERGDYDRIRRAAHDVKGTGTSYGFAVLTDVARLLERAAAAQDLARMERALSSMDTYLQSVEIATGPGGGSPPAAPAAQSITQATVRKAGGA